MNTERRDEDGAAEAQDGFTLVELLVVILIIGILVAISAAYLINQRSKAYEASQKSDLRNVAHQVETQFVDAQTYVLPMSQTGQTVTINGTAVAVSSGTSISLTQKGQNGFCLTGTSSHTGVTWYYDSLAGGVTKAGCSAAAAY